MEKRICKNKISDFIVLYAGFVVYSFASVLAKYASVQNSFGLTAAYLIGEVVVLGVYAIFWQQALKRFPLVVAMSNKGVTVIFSLIWSALLFREEITIVNIVGALIILLGIGMVSADG